MIAILSLFILTLAVVVVRQDIIQFNLKRRVHNVENELAARLDAIDDQISDIGGSVIFMESRLDPDRNQGIRAFNFDYNGNPLTSYTVAVMPERFRRSGEMYVGNPNGVVIPRAATFKDFTHTMASTFKSIDPIVPQAFADGEPYQSFDEDGSDAPRS